MRIKRPDTAFRPGKNTKRVERKDYLSFIRDLPCVTCCASPVLGIDAAHLSMRKPEYGHDTRGLGAKVSDRWALPLCRNCHRKQHDIGEGKFWDRHPRRNKGRDPWLLCLIIYGLWSDYAEEARDRVTEIIIEGDF